MSESLDSEMVARIKMSPAISEAFQKNLNSQKDSAEICVIGQQGWSKVAKVFSEFHNFEGASGQTPSENCVYAADFSTGVKLSEGHSHKVEVDDFASAFAVCGQDSEIIYFESSGSRAVLLACRMADGWSVLSLQSTRRGEPYNWFEGRYERSRYSKRFRAVFGF